MGVGDDCDVGGWLSPLVGPALLRSMSANVQSELKVETRFRHASLEASDWLEDGDQLVAEVRAPDRVGHRFRMRFGMGIGVGHAVRHHFRSWAFLLTGNTWSWQRAKAILVEVDVGSQRIGELW